MTDYTFPQDSGTGAYPENEGDPNDAASFGSLVGATQTTSVIVRGLGFSNINYTNLTFDVDAGKAYLVGDGVTTATSGVARDEVGTVSGFDARTGQTLTDNTVNHIFAATDLSTNDAPYIEINTTDSSPSDPSVKIGEINTTDNTTSERWNLLSGDGTITFPTELAIDSQDGSGRLVVGTNVYDRSTNSQYVITG